MTNLTHLVLSAKEALALSTAIAIASDRVSDAEIAKDFPKSELDAIAEAELIASAQLPDRGLEEDQVVTDSLWEQFWSETDVDYHDWFKGIESACDPADKDQPLGWVEFRDSGLKAAGL